MSKSLGKNKWNLFFYILLLSSIYNCSIKNSNYPQIVKNNGLEKQFDRAKWLMYCYSYNSNGVICEDNYRDSLVNIISQTIKLDTIIFEKEYYTFFFHFQVENKSYCLARKQFRPDRVLFLNNDTVPIILYDVITPTLDGILKQREIELNSKGKTELDWAGIYTIREQNEIFIKYLQNFKGKIDPWLYDQAVKKRILK